MPLLTQGRSRPINHLERGLFLVAAGLQVTRVFCKPEARQGSSFGVGQSPTTADSNCRQRGEGAISRLTDASLLPLKQE